MTINEMVEAVKPRINYDYNTAIRDTLFPLDSFVKQAVVDALSEINNEVRIIEKSVFIPLVESTNYNIDLTLFTKSKFDIVKPINLVLKNSSNLVKYFAKTQLEHILNLKDFYSIYATAFQHLGGQYKIIANAEIEKAPIGIYTKINAKSVDTIDIASTTGLEAGNSVINLDKADDAVYSYRTITEVTSGTVLTFGTNDADKPTWNVGDKLYICSGLPQMFLLTFQANIKQNYFETEDTIPLSENFTRQLTDIVIQNLYQILVVRLPDQAKIWANMVQTGLIQLSRDAVMDIKKKINYSVESPQTIAYNPFSERYGR
jgi:hypothetical protein